MTYCIIAEKPSVARDIAKLVGATQSRDGYLEGGGYLVTWAFGHLLGLPFPDHYGFKAYRAEDLPIIPRPFALIPRQTSKDAELVSDPGVLKQLKTIRSCFDGCNEIIVATDAGREGELIFRWIYEYLGSRKPFRRLWISSLTDKAIREGLQSLKDGRDYDSLYHAARARAEADWLVGINASRALSLVRPGQGALSLGRVQTPCLAMVCRRYLDHKNFSSSFFWRHQISFELDGISYKGVGLEQYDEASVAHSELARLGSAPNLQPLEVGSVEVKTAKIAPPLLYDLTTLQKEANSKHGFSADKTLGLAQTLYEKKVTTYPRTGSRYISEDIFEEIPALLSSLNSHPALSTASMQLSGLSLSRGSVDDAKVTDHHALLITGQSPEGLSKDEQTIYDMIASRMLEAFGEPALKERMSAKLMSGGLEFTFKGERTLSQGWQAVRGVDLSESEDKEEGESTLSALPALKEGQSLPCRSAQVTEHKTKPKPLYTEASLLSAMEHAGREVEDAEARRAMSSTGLGTPATRASIIENLLGKDLITRDKKTLKPTDKGLLVYELVKDKQIANAEMTGQWEQALEEISEGKQSEESFRERIEGATASICRELLSLEVVGTRERKSYVCPRCSEEAFAIFPKVGKCKACELTLWRTVCGKELSEDDLLQLISKGKTKLLKGLKGKSGKAFDAYLVLNASEGTTSFEFPKTTGKPKKR